MGDQPLDDTKPPAPPSSKREPGAYYYDDQTGYKPYDPAEDEDADADEARDEENATGETD